MTDNTPSVHFRKDDGFATFAARMMGPLLPQGERIPVNLYVLGDGPGEGAAETRTVRILAGPGVAMNFDGAPLRRLESAWRTVRRAAWFFLAAGLADAVVTGNVEGTAVLMALSSCASLLYGALAGLGIRPLRRRLRRAMGTNRLDALGAVDLLKRGGWIYLFVVRPLGLRPGEADCRHALLAVVSAEERTDLDGIGRAVRAAGNYVPAEITFARTRAGHGGMLADDLRVCCDAPCPER
jgi:hypothetical protein